MNLAAGHAAAEQGLEFYDRQEVRDPASREQAHFHALPGLLHHAIDNAPGWAGLLAGVDPDRIDGRAAMARLPLARAPTLAALRQAHPPMGQLVATPITRLAKVYPGTVGAPEIEGARLDYWRLARALFAAGFRPGDLVLNAQPYDLTPLGSMVEGGARALGCPVVPAGAAPLAAQLAAATALSPVAYVGSAAGLLALCAAAGQTAQHLPITKALLVATTDPGPALARVRRLPGIAVRWCWLRPELGLIAYEGEPGGGLVVDESVVVEIVDPATGAALADGEEGEVAVTAFNPDSPLIRFATGERSAVMPGESPCGRTNMRLLGPMGPAS